MVYPFGPAAVSMLAVRLRGSEGLRRDDTPADASFRYRSEKMSRKRYSVFSRAAPRPRKRLSWSSLRNVIHHDSTHFQTGVELLIEGSQPVRKTARNMAIIASRGAGAPARNRASVVGRAPGLAEIHARLGAAGLRQQRGRYVGKHAAWARNDEMVGFFLAHPFRGDISAFPQIGAPPAHAMSIGGENMDAPLLHHFLGPI